MPTKKKCKKRKYANFIYARTSLQELREKGRKNLKSVYFCLECEAYHLTSIAVKNMKYIKQKDKT